MLIRVNKDINSDGACVKITQSDFPSPFTSGLEYGAPARGTWNIVHTGMLIPQSHQIFVCASNCLRGVVLTAAEMGAADRFSTITIKENNVLDGDMEDLIIDGVTDILNRLPEIPPAVLLYTSCIHHFMGCDLPMCFRVLNKRFPNVSFTDCYMNPIMRKSGLNPDQIMRKQLYSLLEKKPIDKNSVNIIGNNFATDETSDIVKLINFTGYKLREITSCKTYNEYLDMATSSINITYNPAAKASGEELEKRLGQKHIFLPLSYSAEKIRQNMRKLATALNVEYSDDLQSEEKAEKALVEALKIIGNTPIVIDYTFTMYPLSLARMLVEHGFNVKCIYADSFNADEKDDFEWLQKHASDIMIYATVHVKMRVFSRKFDCKVIALGQKAAYFTGTNYFVNIVEGGGMYGFDGISKLAELMTDAFLNEKENASDLIQQKGLGCGCCI